MRNPIELIGAWSPEKWEAFGTMVTAVVAIAAAVFAWLQVRHARQLREDQAQPFVVVSFEPSPVWGNAINLVVQNIGNTVAKNVRIVSDKPLESKARTDEINDFQLLKQGVFFMPPGMRLQTLFDLTHARHESDLPMTYEVSVSYEGIRGKRETMKYVLDIGIFYGLEQFTEYGLHHAAKAAIDISKTMKKWTGSRGRLKIWTADEDYRNWADRWQHSRGGDTPSLGRPYPAGRPAPSKFQALREPLIVRLYWWMRSPIDQAVQHRRDIKEDKRLRRPGTPS